MSQQTLHVQSALLGLSFWHGMVKLVPEWLKFEAEPGLDFCPVMVLTAIC